MIEINTRGSITNELLIAIDDEEKVEKIMEESIGEEMGKQIIGHLEDVAFIDIKQNSAQTAFEWEANIIICAKEQVVSSIQIMAQRLAERLGASPEDIEYCLEPAVTNLKGF